LTEIQGHAQDHRQGNWWHVAESKNAVNIVNIFGAPAVAAKYLRMEPGEIFFVLIFIEITWSKSAAGVQ
jgi:hypothetical protein